MSGRRQRNFLITIYRLESISSVQIKKVYCLRYEDIVTGKNTILQNFLQQNNENIAFTQKDVLAVRDRLDVSDPFFSELYLQPTIAKKIGSYTKILSKLEICYIECVFSKVMQHWGYLNLNAVMTKIYFLYRLLRDLFR